VIKAHSGAVRSVSYSLDSALILTSSDDKYVKIWSATN
jgi:WD40 repeat protein